MGSEITQKENGEEWGQTTAFLSVRSRVVYYYSLYRVQTRSHNVHYEAEMGKTGGGMQMRHPAGDSPCGIIGKGSRQAQGRQRGDVVRSPIGKYKIPVW